MLNFLEKTRGWKLPLLALIGLIFALNLVLTRKPEPPRTPQVPPPATPFANSIAGIGVIEPKSEVINIGTELSGVVREVLVKVGDKAPKGTALFILDDRATQAKTATLKAQLATARIDAADAADDYNNYRKLYALPQKSPVSKRAFYQRKFAHLKAQAKLKEIMAQINENKTNLERLTVTAPLDAEILSVDIRVGEFAQAGTNAQPLMRLGDTSALYVRVEIDEENAAKINPTTEARAFARGQTNTPIALNFVRFEPLIKPKQNLAVSGQRVDTRVLQVIYKVADDSPLFVGQQLDIFIGQ